MIWLVVALLTAIGMEAWAALVHRWVWHRRLWFVHASHHGKVRSRGFEWNDLLSLSHAPVAAGLIAWGCANDDLFAELALGIGAGMTAFGVAYAVVHDGYVHGRLPLAFLDRSAYFRAIRRTHARHHAAGGAPFGLFYAGLSSPRS